MADSFGSVVQGVNAGMQGQQAAQQSGADQVNNYVQAVQAQQAKQQQAQMLQDKMEEGRYHTGMSLINNAMSMSPEMFKVAHPAMEKRLQQTFTGYQPGTLKGLYENDDNREGWQSYMQAVTSGELPTDAAHMKLFNQVLGNDPGKIEQVLNSINEQRKLKSAQAIKEAQFATQARGQDIGLQGKEVIANAMGARTMRSAGLQANRQYKSEIGPAESAMYQASRANDIINKIQSGDLKSTKTLAADLDSAQASLLGGGKPSTVYGQQAVHMDDVYSRAHNAIQFLTANPQDTQSPAKLEQLKKDVKALNDFYGDQHKKQYSSFRQGIDPTIREHLDERYKMHRENMGLDHEIMEPGQQQQQAAPPQAAAPAQGGQNASKAPMSFEEFKRARASASGGQ